MSLIKSADNAPDWADECERIHGTCDQHRMRPASPELVRRTVLEAAAAWPELAGVPVLPITSPYVHLGGTSALVRTDTLANLREDAAKLAAKAAEAVRSAPKPKPLVSAFPLLEAPLDRAALDRQWARALGVALPEPRAPADTPRLEPAPASVDQLRGEDLPEGWTWNESSACVAEHEGPVMYAGIESDPRPEHADLRGTRFDHADGRSPEIPPAVWAAVEARAVRLGLIADQLRGEDLPEGWFWHERYVCLARQGRSLKRAGYRAYLRTRFSEGEIPPAVWAAVEARAVRLGLIADQAPAGYTFEVDRDGDWLLNHYWAARRSVKCRAGNADPERWAKHEPARQRVAEVSQRAMLRLQSIGLLP